MEAISIGIDLFCFFNNVQLYSNSLLINSHFILELLQLLRTFLLLPPKCDSPYRNKWQSYWSKLELSRQHSACVSFRFIVAKKIILWVGKTKCFWTKNYYLYHFKLHSFSIPFFFLSFFSNIRVFTENLDSYVMFPKVQETVMIISTEKRIGKLSSTEAVCINLTIMSLRKAETYFSLCSVT